MKEKILFGLQPLNSLTDTGLHKVEISMDIKDLSALLFRFSPDAITIDEYKIIFSTGKEMCLIADDQKYIVTNKDQVYQEAVSAYNKLAATQLFYNAISFDYDAACDFIYKDIPDEFEE